MSGDRTCSTTGTTSTCSADTSRDESIDLVYGVSSDPWWQEVMERAFGWFLGDHDLGMPLADPDDGSCRDGLGPDGVNGNMGAESTLAWLVAVERMRALHNEASGHPAGRPIATSR